MIPSRVCESCGQRLPIPVVPKKEKPCWNSECFNMAGSGGYGYCDSCHEKMLEYRKRVDDCPKRCRVSVKCFGAFPNDMCGDCMRNQWKHYKRDWLFLHLINSFDFMMLISASLIFFTSWFYGSFTTAKNNLIGMIPIFVLFYLAYFFFFARSD